MVPVIVRGGTAEKKTEEAAEPPLAPGLPPAPQGHRAFGADIPRGTTILLSPIAAHGLVASLLGHWDVGEGTIALGQLLARGGKLLVARPTDDGAAATELATKLAIDEELPASMRAAFAFVSDSVV